MKKRVSSSEIELARKSSKILFLISFVLLILLFVSFGLLYLFDVDFSSYFEVPETSPVVEKNIIPKKNIEQESSDIELDVNDSNVLKYFGYVRITNDPECENNSYYKDQVLVTKLSTKCKFSLASVMYKESIQTALDGRLYIKEDAVKSVYETLFGNGTYSPQEAIPCLYQTEFIHNDDYYFTQQVADEVGTSIHPYEKIIKAVRNGERLEITSAVLYYESVLNILCRDKDCSDVIKTVKAGEEYGNEYLSLYVDHNMDDLYQYTYHFEMDKSGFYRYVGYDRKTIEK